MAIKKIDWLKILLIILFLLSVYLVLTRIIGHSATDLAITISIFTFLGGLLYNLNREFGEFKIKTIYSFSRVSNDISHIKSDVNEIKVGTGDIRKEIIYMKKYIAEIKEVLGKDEP
ncbi:hypothetical protein HYV89_01685 [Candidatus Woesearchaeota archaeon]|nr:hypothetical protein [Candidatus Woesearchaeota archaeon]